MQPLLSFVWFINERRLKNNNNKEATENENLIQYNIIEVKKIQINKHAS